MNWPRDNDAALDAFYSRPDGSAAWEVTNLTYIYPPWKCYLAGTDVVLSRGIRVHKLVAPSLIRIFDALWKTFGESQSEIEKVDLHQIGGAYYFRARRGSRRLSNHARGIAIDIDPQDNPMGREGKGDMDPRVVAAFKAEGWTWGGDYAGTKDKMHYEAIDNGKVIPWPKKPPPGIIKPIAILNPFIAVPAALDLIKFEEHFMPTVYDDRGKPAIGYGHQLLPGEIFDKPITEAEATEILMKDLRRVWTWLGPLIKVRLTPNQIGALLAWAMNNRPVSVINSTLLKMVNAADMTGAAGQFRLWVNSTNPKTGKKERLAGLVRRNDKIAKLFLTP